MGAVAQLVLKPGRDQALRRRHPWLFSGAIARIEGDPSPGDLVEVRAASGEWLARGAWSASEQLVAKLWTFDPDEAVDEDFFRRHLSRAFALRRRLWPHDPAGAERLVAAEGDDLPGVVVDRYGEYAVLQCLSAGADRQRELLARLIGELAGVRGVFERSDAEIRAREKLPETTGVCWGEEPPEAVEIVENGARFAVDLRHGHKTGFYLDQRVNRAVVAALAAGKRVLNAFCYTGGFGVAAALAGAKEVCNVDSSAEALARAGENFARNQLDSGTCEFINADVFSLLRTFRAQQRRFDLIVLDPPKLVESRKSLMRGARAYKDMALIAFQLLAPGGTLVNFSCSGLMEPALFQKITADAALDAGVSARTLYRLSQSPDHPVSLRVPEGAYLKGLVSVI